jgi:uncharacterized membrane protein
VNTPDPNASATVQGKLQHRAFGAVVLLKGLNGLIEMAGGLALLFVSNAAILGWVRLVTSSELSEDPHDVIANALVHWAQTFGHDSRIYAAVYLLLHGAVKAALAGSLWHGANWAYPAAIIFISVFVVFSAYRLSLGWSIPLAAIIILDLFTLLVIGREWRAHGASMSPRR